MKKKNAGFSQEQGFESCPQGTWSRAFCTWFRHAESRRMGRHSATRGALHVHAGKCHE